MVLPLFWMSWYQASLPCESHGYVSELALKVLCLDHAQPEPFILSPTYSLALTPKRVLSIRIM
uniref:Putative ovule protein n=1 Tax=Solanum chacoense TaxID=4108 RepID=A0A0V0IK83_SOLCH